MLQTISIFNLYNNILFKQFITLFLNCVVLILCILVYNGNKIIKRYINLLKEIIK